MSKSIKLTFLKTGLLTLVVDSSRIGYQQYGVPVGGAMDSESARIANWLVGNESNSALLEINLVGPKIQFENDCQIAITGAFMSPTISGNNTEMNETLLVKKGEILNFGKLATGSRTYLAVRGSWQIAGWKNEDSSQNRFMVQGLNNIQILSPKMRSPHLKVTRSITVSRPVILKVMQGPEFDLLTKDVKQELLSAVFKLLPASNRMGYRLSPTLPKIGSSIISSGVIPGTLQITQDGVPILLMQDGPATGGYVRALNIVSEDLPQLGQLKAGDSLKFELIIRSVCP